MNAAPAKALINEVALELGIDPAFIEKDWYVVQLICILIAPRLNLQKLRCHYQAYCVRCLH